MTRDHSAYGLYTVEFRRITWIFVMGGLCGYDIAGQNRIYTRIERYFINVKF